MRTQDALQAIARAMAPYVGETMARAATAAHCRKLGIGAPSVKTAEIEALLQGLSNGLNVFVGKARSAEAVRSAWEALAALEDSR
jgi:uroporphyrinogen-III synthase